MAELLKDQQARVALEASMTGCYVIWNSDGTYSLAFDPNKAVQSGFSDVTLDTIDTEVHDRVETNSVPFTY